MDNEFLRRIDEHMSRGNEHMSRGNELIADVREQMRLAREGHADLREFIHEQTLRAERVADRQVTAIDALSRRQDESIATMHEMRREITANVATLREETRDLRDESRAQTEALLRLIDRLGEAD